MVLAEFVCFPWALQTEHSGPFMVFFSLSMIGLHFSQMGCLRVPLPPRSCHSWTGEVGGWCKSFPSVPWLLTGYGRCLKVALNTHKANILLKYIGSQATTSSVRRQGARTPIRVRGKLLLRHFWIFVLNQYIMKLLKQN